MSSWTQAQLSMSTGTQALKRLRPNKWTQSYQLSMLARTQAQQSMSKQTQALKQSMPNQWARYQIICFTVIKIECQLQLIYI